MSTGENLPQDTEVAYYAHAFITSSNRVRYAVITITVASTLLFAGHHNSDRLSWFNSRVNVAYEALHEQVWEKSADLPKDQKSIAQRWAEARRLKTREEIQEHVQSLEAARTEHILLLHMPFFGIAFDVNDIGFFGSIALLVLMLMLAFAVSRQHENLYLALWKVRQAWRDEGCPDSPKSYANLIYHTLAMTQQFSRPPSLARWDKRSLRSLSNVLLLSPVIVQAVCLQHDWSSRDLGLALNRNATIISLSLQFASLCIVTVLTVVCLLYTRSNEKRWEKTFFRINPSFDGTPQPSWLEWVQVRAPKQLYCEEHHPGRSRPVQGSVQTGVPQHSETDTGIAPAKVEPRDA